MRLTTSIALLIGALISSCPVVADPGYVGSLPATNGRWNFGGMVGLPGADAQCDANWSGAAVCTATELQAAADHNQLVGITDTGGATVNSFWDENASVSNNRRCFAGAAWDYQTAHFGLFGNVRSLNNGTGALSPIAVSACNSSHHVACCVGTAPVDLLEFDIE